MLAIIPARGGSKGLPNKNLRLLNGKPLICYTIEIALSCSYITHVLVSTDSEEIAEVARKAGAWVPSLRPDELATDMATSIDVYLYTLDLLKMDYSLNFDSFIVLQPTSPLRTLNDVYKSIDIFKQNNADSVISYTKEHHPVYWHKNIDDKGKISDIFLENNFSNRQQFPVTYYPNGAVYIFKTNLIKESKKYYTDKTLAYLMPRNRSVDIDDIDDFIYAEFLLSNEINKK